MNASNVRPPLHSQHPSDPNLFLHELQAQASKLAHADLTVRLRAANDALASVSHRHSELSKDLAQADATTRTREAQLALERGYVVETDSELATLRAEQARIKEALRSLAAEEQASKQVQAVLRVELETRAAELDREVTQKVQKSWKGRDAEARDAARKALAESICAYAHGRTTLPQMVQPHLFLAEILEEALIGKFVSEMVNSERAKERAAIIKRNPHLGSV